MVTGIDVYFTGLMLICFAGQPDCPHGNTAWVVRADGEKSLPCGWNSKTTTTLELQFKCDDFSYKEDSFNSCSPKTCSPNEADKLVSCKLGGTEGPQRKICVEPDNYNGPKNTRLDSSLLELPRLDEVDRRFKAVNPERLGDPYYVPTVIYFPGGVIASGGPWPPVVSPSKPVKPRRWFRSDGSAGGALPRELSDRVKVSYEGSKTLTIKYCGYDEPLIKLTAKKTTAEVTIRNSADELHADEVGQYEDIAYLIWYYRLGTWDTPYGSCPNYTTDKKDAVLLRCVRDGDSHCSYYGNGEKGTIFWPPDLLPCVYWCPPL